MHNNHVILRSEVEVTIDNYDQHRVIQRIINKVVKEQIIPILSKLFSTYDSQDIVIHLDKLIVDGGHVTFYNLKKHLASQIEFAFLPILKKHIEKAIRNPSLNQVTPLSEAKLQTIEYYLSKGHFAWWMTAHSEKQIEKLYVELLHESPVLIEQLWYRLKKKEKAIERYIIRFSDAAIKSTLNLLSRDLFKEYTPILTEIEHLLHKVKIIKNHLYAPKQQLLSATLEIFLNQRSTTLTRIGFINSLLHHLTKKTSIRYGQLLEKFHHAYIKETQNPISMPQEESVKALILHLHDISIFSPSLKNKDIQDAEVIVKELDSIRTNNLLPYQLLQTINHINTSLQHPHIRNLVKSWLKEDCNRICLSTKLSDTIFISFIHSMEPSIGRQVNDLIQIGTDCIDFSTISIDFKSKIKNLVLKYCAFTYQKKIFFEKIQFLFEEYFTADSTFRHLKEVASKQKGKYSLEVETILMKLTPSPSLSIIGANKLQFKKNIEMLPNKKTSIYPPTLPNKGKTPADQLDQWLHPLNLPNSFPQQLSLYLPEEKFYKILQILFYFSIENKYKNDFIVSAETLIKENIFLQEKILQGEEQSIWLNVPSKIMLENLAKLLLRTENIKKETDPSNRGQLLRWYLKSALHQFYTPPVFSTGKNPKYHNDLQELLLPTQNLVSRTLPIRNEEKTKSTGNNLEKKRNEALFSLTLVVNFLRNNELPSTPSAPIYFLSTSLEQATPEQIRDYLALLCQEPFLLKKLIQHTTTKASHKLYQAFIPFQHTLLEQLEEIILEANILQSTPCSTSSHLLKEIFITAALFSIPPTTHHQYLERIVLHIGTSSTYNLPTLCDCLATTAKKTNYFDLSEDFTLLSHNFRSLGINKIDSVELAFLPIHEKIGKQLISKEALPIYYNKLLPAIKNILQQPLETVEEPLPIYYDKLLPTVKNILQQPMATVEEDKIQTITIWLATHCEKITKEKKEQITEKWNVFLHTGALGNYAHAEALLKELPPCGTPPFLAEELAAKLHIRQRLIAHFTHEQLLQLVRKYSLNEEKLVTYIKSLYVLWRDAQNILGQTTNTKNFFWETILSTLPPIPLPFSTLEWMEPIVLAFAQALKINTSLFLHTLHLSTPYKEPISGSEDLATLLYTLKKKHLYPTAPHAENGPPYETTLKELHLLLNEGSNLFFQKYSMPINKLEKKLIQYLSNFPSQLSTMLKQQLNKSLVSRSLVHFFNKNLIEQILLLLAQEKQSFVRSYLKLLNRLYLQKNPPWGKEYYWQKELFISILDYLLKTDKIEEKDLLKESLYNAFPSHEIKMQIISSIETLYPIHPEENKITILLKPIAQELASLHLTISTLDDTPNPKAPLPPTPLNKKVQKKEKKYLNKEIRIYTQNSGLIFLYPFLNDFLKKHGLIEQNVFTCQQAVHNAVYLLDYLITGKLNSPESQLALPKLLCGLTYDEILRPYQDIEGEPKLFSSINENEEDKRKKETIKNIDEDPYTTKKENSSSIKISEEKQTFLEKNKLLLIKEVMERWKDLTKLKKVESHAEEVAPDHFKNFFLRKRIGILLKRPFTENMEITAWHLTLIHQRDEDLNVLPPWPVDSVKLPWMQETIMVFWV